MCARQEKRRKCFAGEFSCAFCSAKMKKFNIRKVLDGLKEVSSSTPSVQVGPQENHLFHETLQSDHFQLCKVRESAAGLLISLHLVALKH